MGSQIQIEFIFPETFIVLTQLHSTWFGEGWEGGNC